MKDQMHQDLSSHKIISTCQTGFFPGRHLLGVQFSIMRCQIKQTCTEKIERQVYKSKSRIQWWIGRSKVTEKQPRMASEKQPLPSQPRTHFCFISLCNTVLKEPLESPKQGARNLETSISIEARCS